MYYSNFKDRANVEKEFGIDRLSDEINIIFAEYIDDDCYCSEAFVLFKKDGKLFEVNASHCSCYDLANQWEPEETQVDALIHRLNSGRFDDFHKDELSKLLKTMAQ